MDQEDDENMEGDTRIQSLAAEIADANDPLIPRLLLKLTDILNEASGSQLQRLKAEIWELDLLEVVVMMLRQDFTKMHGGWKTAVQLVKLLCKCSFGFEGQESDEFAEFLQKAAERVLIVTRKIQIRFTKTSSHLQAAKLELSEHFNSMLDSLMLLFSPHPSLTISVVKSSTFQEMLMSDDVEVAKATLNTIQTMVRTKQNMIGSLDKKSVNNMLDEIVYKLSTGNNNELARSAIKTILTICDMHSPTVELICSRFSGLRPMLTKWSGHGFDRDLQKLLSLLRAGNAEKARVQHFDHAASVIQAVWKSYYTRKKLKKADSAFSKFQRSFRAKQSMKEKRQDEDKEQSELQHLLVMRRRKAMRDLHNKRLEALKILPAAEVNRYMENEEREAAIKIQAHVRGFLVRLKLHGKQDDIRQTRAAIKIQRAVRSWLERGRKRKREPPGWQRPPGLSDQRRVELHEHITDWRENHPPKAQTEEERKTLHEQVQGMLKQYVISSRITRKNQLHRQALLARLEVDSDLILSGPELVEATEKDVESYTCFNVPIATKARYNHNQELRLLNQPWWRKLGDEYQDSKTDEDLDWKIL